MSRTPEMPAQGGRDIDDLDRRLDAAVEHLASRSQLPADRYAFHQEHLMNAISELSRAELNQDENTTNASAVVPDADRTGPFTGRGRGSVRAAWARMGRTKRRILVGAACLLAVGITATGPALAEQAAYWVGPHGVGMVEVEQLEVEYRGTLYTWDQIDDLQAKGKAGVTVMDRDSARDQGIAHAFDTQQEADAWGCVHILRPRTGQACPGSTDRKTDLEATHAAPAGR